MLYFHPWELDSDIPDVSAFDTLTHVRQYRNLGKLQDLLPRYFEEAEFGTARDYLNLSCRCANKKTASVVKVKKPEDSAKVLKDGQPVSIVIPCYNEEATIDFLSRALDEVTEAANGLYNPHYYLVDDKSTDATVKFLKETFSDKKRYTIVELPENRGVSGAIHAGINAAQTEIVCSIDADCSYDPLELLKMIPFLNGDTSLVTASPYHADGAVLGVPGWRLFLSRGLSGIYRFILNHKLATYTSCFRVYKRSVALKYTPEYGDFRGIVELLAKMDIAGEQIKEYPTTLQSRIFGFSKMKTLKTIRDHIRLLNRMSKYKRKYQKELKTLQDQ
jgi:glycosyltransferase involved in cell wall biosynthesis